MRGCYPRQGLERRRRSSLYQIESSKREGEVRRGYLNEAKERDTASARSATRVVGQAQLNARLALVRLGPQVRDGEQERAKEDDAAERIVRSLPGASSARHVYEHDTGLTMMVAPISTSAHAART